MRKTRTVQRFLWSSCLYWSSNINVIYIVGIATMVYCISKQQLNSDNIRLYHSKTRTLHHYSHALGDSVRFVVYWLKRLLFFCHSCVPGLCYLVHFCCSFKNQTFIFTLHAVKWRYYTPLAVKNMHMCKTYHTYVCGWCSVPFTASTLGKTDL